MASRRLKAVAAFVVAAGLLQILFEDVLLFFAATGIAPPALLRSRYVMMAIPLATATLLAVVLVGGALLSQRPRR